MNTIEDYITYHFFLPDDFNPSNVYNISEESNINSIISTTFLVIESEV